MIDQRKGRAVKRKSGHAALPVILCLLAWSIPAQCAEVTAEHWPEADGLFKRDSRWRGSDAANSIDLGNGRVLWTFGDTFVDMGDQPDKRHRTTSVMINNSVAIQTGYDPTQATFEAFWKTTDDGEPAAFFRGVGEVFYWPGGGVLLDDKLLIYMMRVRTQQEGIGFKVLGWGAVLIDNPHDRPAEWKIDYFDFDHTDHDIMIGCGSSLRQGEWLYTFGGNSFHLRSTYLARFVVDDILQGDFTRPEWWNADEGRWQSQSCGQQEFPPPLFAPGAPEFTVHFDAKLNQYLIVQTDCFPVGRVTLRRAPRLTGPWKCWAGLPPVEEARHPMQGLTLYSAKAHPEQEAEGLAVTYCTNNKDLGEVVRDESLYYPRFLRIEFAPNSGPGIQSVDEPKPGD